MPDQLQLRGGTTADHTTFTGASKEVTIDTTKKTAVVHDASTAGGNPLMREDGANSALIDGSAAAPALAFAAGTGDNGIFSPGADQVAVSTNGVERVEWGASEVVFNDGGENYDFRVEGDTEANLLFVDASTDRVGVGTANPGRLLHIKSTDARLRIEQDSGTTGSATLELMDSGRTTPYFIYASEDGALRFQDASAERMRIDSSGRLLVGTSTSSAITTAVFEGNSSSSTGASSIHLQRGSTPTGVQDFGTINFADNNGDTGAWILGERDNGTWTSGSSHPGALQFGTTADGSASPTVRMRIDSSGNVGIGTTSPSTRLHVSDTDAAITFEGTRGTGATHNITTGGANSQNLILNVNDDLFLDANDIIFRSASDSERARIDSSGRLLVNTSSSTANTLAVFRGYQGRADQQSIVTFDRGTAPGTQETLSTLVFSADTRTAALLNVVRDSGTWTAGSSHPTRMEFSTTADGASSPTQRMKIDSSGVVHTFGALNGVIAHTIGGASSSYVFFRGYHSATAGVPWNGTVTFQVNTNGNVANTNNSYGALSDVKLKENIVDASSQWDDLKAIQVRNYNFKEGQTHTQIGVVAQEVELVSPGLVGEIPDTDAEGNELGTTTKTVNYSVLYMKAVKALQEAMDRIETLEAKVAALEAN